MYIYMYDPLYKCAPFKLHTCFFTMTGVQYRSETNDCKPHIQDHGYCSARIMSNSYLALSLASIIVACHKAMDLMQNYPILFKIINFKGAGGPMFKT